MAEAVVTAGDPMVAGRSTPRARRAPLDYALAAIPVRIALIDRDADLPALVAAAVRGIAGSDDIVAVSETAVAIAQSRIVDAQTVRPSPLANALAARAGALATVNQPESLQLVIDDVGAPKVVLAALAQVLGRLVGIRGGFYRVLGETIAAIDGYTGTLPPFDRTIVLGPRDPGGAAAAIARACGAHAVVVDANDLGIVNVLGASPGVDRAAIARALRPNPHGNGDEQTPIVVLARRTADAPRLLRS